MTKKSVETRMPGRERISLRAGDLNDLSSSWKYSRQVYYSIPALLFQNYNKGYLNPTFKLQYKEKGYFSLGDDLANNENKPTPFFPRVFFTMGDWS